MEKSQLLQGAELIPACFPARLALAQELWAPFGQAIACPAARVNGVGVPELAGRPFLKDPSLVEGGLQLMNPWVSPFVSA